VRETA
jgi:hypothetical protein